MHHSKRFGNSKISGDAILNLKARFDKAFDSQANNAFIKAVLSYLKELDCPICGIRCLGLGSIESEVYPLHQLCLLKRIVDQQCPENENEITVSLWDPVFTDLDKEFIETTMHYVVQEDSAFESGRDDVLYYMPHFPIEEIEKIFSNYEPKLLFTNDLQTYSLRLSSRKYLSLYPICASVSFLTDEENLKDTNSQSILQINASNGFHSVKRNHKNRRKKCITPILPNRQDYKLDTRYFTKADIKRFPYDFNSTLEFSLSDMCFIKLTKRSTHDTSI